MLRYPSSQYAQALSSEPPHNSLMKNYLSCCPARHKHVFAGNGEFYKTMSTTSYNTYKKRARLETPRWHKVVRSFANITPQRHQSFGSLLLSPTARGSLFSCCGVSTIALPCIATSFDSPAALKAACCNCGLTVVISVVGWDPLR